MECHLVHTYKERKLKNKDIELPTDSFKAFKEAYRIDNLIHDYFYDTVDEKITNEINSNEYYSDLSSSDSRIYIRFFHSLQALQLLQRKKNIYILEVKMEQTLTAKIRPKKLKAKN